MNKLIEYFINEPERQFHVRELAKLAKLSPATTSKHLSNLQKERLLISEKKLNHLLYKADNESQAFKDKKLYYNIRKIKESGLITHLVDQFNHPKAIILFGSFSKAENILKSDIDLLVISAKKEELNLSKYEKSLNHSIQLFVMSEKDITRMKIKNKELLNSLVNGKVIYGYWELFK